MSLRRSLAVSAVLTGALLAAACNPTLRTHGYRYSDGEVPEFTVGEDTEATVLDTLGNPSTRGAFEDNTWYYISATREYLAYLRPETRDRRVLTLRFDDNGTLAEIEEYGVEDGRVVAFIDRETPTRGRELTVLEQLLGNVGRLPGETFGGEQNLPGGAGGPRPDGS
ncbi:outer membrane protein assembly factor BamE [Marinicauda pacifica]|jgi:outer membrane protein assembly factor BamE (lipoprotein component of BamABCDE complex)|uniref:Outer membrane protein assembly factor BamE n=1 Tax=Marinicauda pacifica TaxID=1133559 RepID=A0A4S2HER9_9PROT|nr:MULTISPECIES: outer membrane protein assembly factor BamE [Marinicauda]TGY94570.1 outer membrane protein assembly factor BamE [Marinicauda pacifica]GGE36959.1 outer membrane protein assembly factor BamE [Marinicauda pacifica]